MDSVLAKLEYIIFENKETHYVVASFSQTNTYHLFTGAGRIVDPMEDQEYELSGEYIRHPKYGTQFKIESYKKILPTHEDAIIHFLSSDAFPTIGKQTARQIYELLGDTCLEQIKEDYSILYQIPKLNQKRIDIIKKGIEEFEGFNDTYIQLMKFGLDDRKIRLLEDTYKDKVLDTLKENCFLPYYEIYGFTPEEKFHVIAGIHTSPMIAGDENGDSFSMGKVREGSFVSMISDGMGTGQEAKKESRKIIEVMEELLGAGINESQSIQLLRSMMILQPEKEKYATLDFFQLDLFAGIGTFFKIGACPCLLKRKNDVEIIQVDTIPVNLLLHTEKIPIYRKKMESEDILVMLSDGAFDGFSQNGLEMAARYLKEMDVVRPQAIADGLYEQITTNKEFEKRDDMTIMVLGIWDRY